MKTQSKHTAETVMAEFNLSSESFDSLPRGLASELGAVLKQRDDLLAALKAVVVWNMTAATERDWSSYRLAVMDQARAAIASAEMGDK